MSQETSAQSVVKTFKASAAIHAGHAVTISAAGTATEAAAGHTAVGVYIGEEDAAAGDNVAICVLGPCRAWADATVAITVAPNCYLADNTDAHMHTEASDGARALGVALEPKASGTGYIEMLVSPFIVHA